MVTTRKRMREMEVSRASNGQEIPVNGENIGQKRKQHKKKKHKSQGLDVELVFVVCPGAGGTLPKTMKEGLVPFLEELGTVVFPEKRMGPRKIGEKMLGAFHEWIESVAERFPDAKIYFVTQSYGGRVCAHYLSQTTMDGQDIALEVPSNVKGLLSFGYPLHHDKQDRSGPLRRLPDLCSFLFISGTSDHFLGNLEELVSSKTNTTFHLVEKAGHNVFDLLEKDGPSKEQTLNIIRNFLKV